MPSIFCSCRGHPFGRLCYPSTVNRSAWHYQDSLLTPANSSPVIHVHMTFPTDNEGPCHYDMLIPSRVIWHHYKTMRQFMHDSCDRIIIPPVYEFCQAARLLPGFPIHENSVCGSRFVTKETDLESGKHFVAMYDFCPLEAVLRDLGRGEDVEFGVSSVPLEDHFPGCAGETAASYRRTKTNITLEENE